VGDYTQRPHLWLIFTSKLSTPPASVAVDASAPQKLWSRVLLARGARPDDGGWCVSVGGGAALYSEQLCGSLTNAQLVVEGRAWTAAADLRLRAGVVVGEGGGVRVLFAARGVACLARVGRQIATFVDDVDSEKVVHSGVSERGCPCVPLLVSRNSTLLTPTCSPSRGESTHVCPCATLVVSTAEVRRNFRFHPYFSRHPVAVRAGGLGHVCVCTLMFLLVPLRAAAAV